MRVCGRSAWLEADGDSGGDKTGTAGTEIDKRETDSFIDFSSSAPVRRPFPGVGRWLLPVIAARQGGV